MKNSESEDEFLSKWEVKRQNKLRYILIYGGVTSCFASIIYALILLLTGLKTQSEIITDLPFMIVVWIIIGLLEGWYYYNSRESEYKRILKSRRMPIPDRK